jgi:hypothetical protein
MIVLYSQSMILGRVLRKTYCDCRCRQKHHGRKRDAFHGRGVSFGLTGNLLLHEAVKLREADVSSGPSGKKSGAGNQRWAQYNNCSQSVDCIALFGERSC